MVNHYSAAAIFVSAGIASLASTASDFDRTLQPKKYRLGPIQSVMVQDRTAKGFGAEADCGHLAIDEKRVRFFLANAQFRSEYQYSQELQTGDCNAQARVTFKDGRAAKVSIDNWTGWGAITARGTTYFMRCGACTDILEASFPFDGRKPIRPGACRRNALYFGTEERLPGICTTCSCPTAPPPVPQPPESQLLQPPQLLDCASAGCTRSRRARQRAGIHFHSM